MTVGQLKKILAPMKDNQEITISDTDSGYGDNCAIFTVYENIITGEITLVTEAYGAVREYLKTEQQKRVAEQKGDVSNDGRG